MSIKITKEQTFVNDEPGGAGMHPGESKWTIVEFSDWGAYIEYSKLQSISTSDLKELKEQLAKLDLG